MQRIERQDLQANKVYYIEHRSGKYSETPGKINKIKGICENNDCNGDKWARFVRYKHVNSTESYDKDVTSLTYWDFQSTDYPDFLDPVMYSFGPDSDVTYYLPQRDIIIQRKEREMVNDVLKFLIGDPGFRYY